MKNNELLDIYPRHELRIRRMSRLRALRHRVIPRHTWRPMAWELRMAWLRLRTLFTHRRFRGARGLLVNVAPGHKSVPEWVNIDAIARAGVTCVYDCRRRLPFPGGSVRVLFSEHFFEHLDYTEEAQPFLRESLRVLEPGGILRLIVPDGERYLDGYVAPGWQALERLHPLSQDHVDPHLGGRYTTKMELVNVVFRQGHQHRFAYDFETLAALLGRSGFSQVTRRAFREGLCPEFCIDDPAHESHSLYVEAVRGDGPGLPVEADDAMPPPRTA